ncbi:MAG: BrnT family toxin [Phenylobacterium sp.]|uniref:BrnT family toxin n=1 Tax=Phenylobacterium sp. TaxID=1871053 RepID=UPI001A439DFA|nr:BrnT family toxin [Phenylobacterium sp.]MBL8554902.1 BrnT family toxin [Phenylobacterium sp.]
MDVEFDAAKDQANIAKHGVSLALASALDFGTALIFEDDRFAYDEVRWVAIGFIEDRLFSLVFVDVDDDIIRAISLRTASRREALFYARETR